MSDPAIAKNQLSPRIVFYSTSVPALQKVRADIATITRVFEAKKVVYEEVRGTAANKHFGSTARLSARLDSGGINADC